MPLLPIERHSADPFLFEDLWLGVGGSVNWVCCDVRIGAGVEGNHEVEGAIDVCVGVG